VTVKKLENVSKNLRGQVVSPETPRVESGLYWGYQVRYAESFRRILTGNLEFKIVKLLISIGRYISAIFFSASFKESSFGEKYDLKIGVNLTNRLEFEHILDDLPSEVNARRVLVVYGGLCGLETAMESDEKLKANKTEQLFDVMCQSEQVTLGSRSVRLEVGFLPELNFKSALNSNFSFRTLR
jgi:hypothetical protein